MPTKAQFLKLFDLHRTLPRSSCVALQASIAHDASGKPFVSAVFSLFDSTASKPSGQSLFVGLDRVQAQTLAKLIQNLAKEQSWPDLPDETVSRTLVPPANKLS